MLVIFQTGLSDEHLEALDQVYEGTYLPKYEIAGYMDYVLEKYPEKFKKDELWINRLFHTHISWFAKNVNLKLFWCNYKTYLEILVVYLGICSETFIGTNSAPSYWFGLGSGDMIQDVIYNIPNKIWSLLFGP